jgi:hypothetical protein
MPYNFAGFSDVNSTKRLTSRHLRLNTPSEYKSGSRVSTPGSPFGVFVNLQTTISQQLRDLESLGFVYSHALRVAVIGFNQSKLFA